MISARTACSIFTCPDMAASFAASRPPSMGLSRSSYLYLTGAPVMRWVGITLRSAAKLDRLRRLRQLQRIVLRLLIAQTPARVRLDPRPTTTQPLPSAKRLSARVEVGGPFDRRESRLVFPL